MNGLIPLEGIMVVYRLGIHCPAPQIPLVAVLPWILPRTEAAHQMGLIPDRGRVPEEVGGSMGETSKGLPLKGRSQGIHQALPGAHDPYCMTSTYPIHDDLQMGIKQSLVQPEVLLHVEHVGLRDVDETSYKAI